MVTEAAVVGAAVVVAVTITRKKNRQIITASTAFAKSANIHGGGVAEWFRALDLKSGGPWFKSFTLPLSGFVLGSPEFNSSTALCK